MRTALTRFLSCSVLCLATAGCDVNVFESVASKNSDAYWLEEARIQIDQESFGDALEALNHVGSDSNELRLIRSAARLGQSGLSLWSVLLTAIDGTSYSKTDTTSGTDQVFNSISSAVVGTGETKTSRLEALSSAVEDLLAAPDASAARVRNMSCFLAGVMALPTVEDTNSAVQSTISSLNSIAATTNTSNPSASCPDTTNLTSSLALISSAQARFGLILKATESCTFLDTSSGSSSLNAIEIALKKFSAQADKGCSSTPSCSANDAACKALGLNCVYEALNADGATSKASDGTVSSCELVQNCLDPTQCF